MKQVQTYHDFQIGSPKYLELAQPDNSPALACCKSSKHKNMSICFHAMTAKTVSRGSKTVASSILLRKTLAFGSLCVSPDRMHPCGVQVTAEHCCPIVREKMAILQQDCTDGCRVQVISLGWMWKNMWEPFYHGTWCWYLQFVLYSYWQRIVSLVVSGCWVGLFGTFTPSSF